MCLIQIYIYITIACVSNLEREGRLTLNLPLIRGWYDTPRRAAFVSGASEWWRHVHGITMARCRVAGAIDLVTHINK